MEFGIHPTSRHESSAILVLPRVSNAAERFSILTAGNGGEENQGHRTRIMQKMPNRKAWSACIGIGMEGDG